MAAKGFDVVYTHGRSRFPGGYEIISLLQKFQDDAIRGAEVNRLRLVRELSHELLEILYLGLMVGSVLP